MQRQVSLFGEKMRKVNSKFERAEKPWKDVCCEACWNATQKRCECKCRGKYHGKGRRKPVEWKRPSKELLESNIGQPSDTEREFWQELGDEYFTGECMDE